MNEQTTAAVYEPPVLVEVGEFSKETLGAYGSTHLDGHGYYSS